MSVTPTDYLAAIAQLPAGAALCLNDVPWEEYENLLADLGESYAVRIFYDRGRMEIMAPASAHERPKGIIHRLITALSDELDIDVEFLGSTTLKREMEAKGAEPADCFYIQSATFVIGNEDLDLNHDPPPDLVVEIDRTSSSLNRFAIYSGLRVPEIWRVIGHRVDIYVLNDECYKQSTTSRAFHFLSAQAISEFLVQGIVEGERKVARAFRSWVRAHHHDAVGRSSLCDASSTYNVWWLHSVSEVLHSKCAITAGLRCRYNLTRIAKPVWIEHIFYREHPIHVAL